MNEEEARALFLLAGIEATDFYKLVNQYWPAHPDFDEMRRRSPWWLVKTPHGLIKIGWRKQVISIDWSDTPARIVVTEDTVTKDKQMVHAWSYAKALEYLSILRSVLCADWNAVSAQHR